MAGEAVKDRSREVILPTVFPRTRTSVGLAWMMDSQHVKPLPVYPRVCAMETNVIPYKASPESKYLPCISFLPTGRGHATCIFAP